jgi:hypothetical protein
MAMAFSSPGEWRHDGSVRQKKTDLESIDQIDYESVVKLATNRAIFGAAGLATGSFRRRFMLSNRDENDQRGGCDR